jgi:hypothetical protein
VRVFEKMNTLVIPAPATMDRIENPAHSRGKIGCFAKIVSESMVGIKAALRIGQVSNNRAHFFVTGVFDGQDRRRRDEDGERE